MPAYHVWLRRPVELVPAHAVWADRPVVDALAHKTDTAPEDGSAAQTRGAGISPSDMQAASVCAQGKETRQCASAVPAHLLYSRSGVVVLVLTVRWCGQ
jgi:hypothetical protein